LSNKLFLTLVYSVAAYEDEFFEAAKAASSQRFEVWQEKGLARP